MQVINYDLEFQNTNFTNIQTLVIDGYKNANIVVNNSNIEQIGNLIIYGSQDVASKLFLIPFKEILKNNEDLPKLDWPNGFIKATQGNLTL